jgi:hypothetical protein
MLPQGGAITSHGRTRCRINHQPLIDANAWMIEGSKLTLLPQRMVPGGIPERNHGRRGLRITNQTFLNLSYR